MIDFKPVEIEDLNRLTPFLRRYGSSSCQHAFVSMLGLKEKYMDEFCFINDICSERIFTGCACFAMNFVFYPLIWYTDKGVPIKRTDDQINICF